MSPATGQRGKSWVHLWATDSAVLLVSQSLTVLATSAAAILIARTLSPHEWGIFSAFLGMSLGLAIIVNFGVATWLLREFSRLFAGQAGSAQSVGDSGTLLTAGLTVNATVAASLVLAGGIVGIAAGFGGGTTFALVALMSYGGLLATGSALEAHLRARRRLRLVAFASVTEKSVLIGLIALGVFAGSSIAAVGAAYLVAGLLRVSFEGVIVFVAHGTRFVRPTWAAVVGVARQSFPFALTAGSINLVPRLDTFFIAIVSTTGAAWFAIGDRILGPAFLVAATVATTLYPFMPGRSPRALAPWKVAGGLGLVGVALSALGIVLAPTLVPLLFGSDYEPAVPVTQVMLLVLPFFFATEPLLVFTYSNGRERSMIVATLCVSISGTIAIVAAQVIAGVEYAAGAYVIRSALVFLVVIAVGLSIRERGSPHRPHPAPAPAPAPAPDIDIASQGS